tara:strand:- start:5 stop:415 length:411 start_codon:yes stop_codon:yes gene_type:complete
MADITILEVRNCKYTKEDNSLIDCEAKFVGYPDEWLPFTANPNDPEAHGRLLYANAVNGDYGAVAAFTHPTLEWELQNIRWKRTELLQETDWTQNADVPQATKDKWATYRQELRDITEGIDTAAKARAVTWPTEPA